MKVILVSFLCLCCLCASTHPNKNSKINKTKEIAENPKKAEIIILNQICKDKIELELKQENGTSFKFIEATRNIGSDTTTAYYQNSESRETGTNSMWVYLDNNCNILGKKSRTIHNPKE